MATLVLYPRKCTNCGRGMAEGHVIEHLDKYFCTECTDALNTELREAGFATQEEAYNEDFCYYTEWGDLDGDEAYTEEGETVEL